MALPLTVSNTKLWQTTLAFRNEDQYQHERERLRSTFLNFREASGYLAEEIRRDLPNLTVHDLTHLDALWEIASIIAGKDYNLTPTEAFVLGGAILLHDLAMSIAAIEGGFEKIKEDQRWRDLVAFEYQSKYDRTPTKAEFEAPEPSLFRRALFNLLRQIHAENAEKLAYLSFKSTDGSPIFLIQDVEIRQTFGRLIGQIAHSHWWSITEVEKQFSRVVGAPHWCPPEWTIDPIKIACILRAADASHLDARRAPTFLKAITNLPQDSIEHWIFQEKLNKPYLREDALVYTASRSFSLREASAWWLCLDTLRTADKELRSVDALFAEKGYQRFSAKRIAGVDTPERLATYIYTEGWLPINATVHVTDLPNIIRSIGGKELYGDQPQIVLRELVQNACDAIRARRKYENRDPVFGDIMVKLSESSKQEFWLEVLDTGIGMSQRVLTDFLLDFGRSFWSSPQLQEELPGLLSSGIKPIGKYGIGFFSVFMIAQEVYVATRRPDLAAHDTLVLEFGSGLEGRPILRPAEKQEQLLEGGTHVKLKLNINPYSERGLLYEPNTEEAIPLEKLVPLICPAIDANLYVSEQVKPKSKIIDANDWQFIDGIKLLDRMRIKDRFLNGSQEKVEEFKKQAALNLRNLTNEDGEIVGRALITPGYAIIENSDNYLSGVVTVGGLEASHLSGICGILVGQPLRASREDAKPIVSEAALRSWAEDQCVLVPNLYTLPEQQAACAQYIWMCGGDTKQLPICLYQGKWISADGIAKMTTIPDSIIIVDHFSVDVHLKLVDSYVLESNVFVTRLSGYPGLLNARSVEWPKDRNTNFISSTGSIPYVLAAGVIKAVAKAWNVSEEEVQKSNNNFKTERDIKVGMMGEKELILSALTISKPRHQDDER